MGGGLVRVRERKKNGKVVRVKGGEGGPGNGEDEVSGNEGQVRGRGNPGVGGVWKTSRRVGV